MNSLVGRDRRIVDAMLLVVTVGMTYLLYRMGGHKMVVLNLYYLPIVLGGYFLGRTSAGVMALLSVLCVTVAVTMDTGGFSGFNSPIMIGLALTVWGATLGLTAILVGTLCDERAKTMDELHAAYVGVVEVLSKYLQSGNPNVKARSTRIAELSQAVAEEMRLTRKEVDDIRVGALLYDLGNVEITTQLLSKAVGALEANSEKASSYTFSGTELVHSLGSVLQGAVPLLLSQDEAVQECLPSEGSTAGQCTPQGAKIIRTVRAFDALADHDSADDTSGEQGALQELRKDVSGGWDPDILVAMERCINRVKNTEVPVPAFA